MSSIRKRIGILAAFASLAIGMMTMPVSAEGNYTTIKGEEDQCQIDKYLVVENDATIPTVSFDFTIKPGEKIDAEAGKMAVYAGPAGGVIGGVTGVSPSVVMQILVPSNEMVTLAAASSVIFTFHETSSLFSAVMVEHVAS